MEILKFSIKTLELVILCRHTTSEDNTITVGGKKNWFITRHSFSLRKMCLYLWKNS